MSDARTALAAIACVAIIVAVGAIAGHDPYQPQPHKPTAPARRELAEPNEQLTAPGEPAARQLARRFLVAYAAYETGDRSPTVRDELTRTATPALAATLLRDPPRRVGGFQPARRAAVGPLTLSDASSESLRYLTAIRRGALQETFSLLMAPTSSGWQVNEVTQ